MLVRSMQGAKAAETPSPRGQMEIRDEVTRRVRQLIAEGSWSLDGRLPPERELAVRLGVSRSDLRRALAKLEAEGQVWRHVGKGTFVGPRPTSTSADLSTLAYRTSPAEVMRTRVLLEPIAAELAAVNATPEQVAAMRHCLVKTRMAKTFQQYVLWDNRLHSTISEATRNSLLIAFLHQLHSIRRTVVWGRLREKEAPSTSNPSIVEHEEIVAAIVDHDPLKAGDAMRRHLSRVEAELVPKPYWP